MISVAAHQEQIRITSADPTLDPPIVDGVKFSMWIDGIKIDGPCGLTLEVPRFLEFMERLSPDQINGSEYIPAMPIEIPHAG